MRYAVIDVGSNSVRLMLWENGTLYKKIACTRLAENMSDGFLDGESLKRTARAVCLFASEAEKDGAGVIFIFGTAALRKAKNREKFSDAVKDGCGLYVDVISGEKEAEIGALGALKGADGGVVDVGGASTEIVVIAGGKPVYEKSADVGTVTVKDACGEDLSGAFSLISEKIGIFGAVPKTDFTAIGGTATSLAAISLALEVYDPEKVNGYILTLSEIKRLREKLYKTPLFKRFELKGLQRERAEVIPSGANILCSVMEKYGIERVKISESDNLEGYLADKLKNEKEI